MKLFKKGVNDEYFLDQRLTLTVSEFQAMINNVENIAMEPLKDEPVLTTLKPWNTNSHPPSKVLKNSSKSNSA